MKPEPLIRKNEVITCPKCFIALGTFSRDVFMGERQLEGDIIGIGSQTFRNGDLMNCRKCDTPFAECGATFIHLERGWVPPRSER